MPNSINLSFTDELRAFVDANSGDGSLYKTGVLKRAQYIDTDSVCGLG